MIIGTNSYTVMVVGAGRLKDVLAHDTKIAPSLPVVAELRAGFLGGVRPAENELALSKFLT